MPALNITTNRETTKKKPIISKKFEDDLKVKSSKKFLNQEKNAKAKTSASRTERKG